MTKLLKKASLKKYVVILALPGVRELDLVNAVDVFSTANYFLPADPPYRIEVVTAQKKGHLIGMNGLRFAGNKPYTECTAKIDTLLVGGGIRLVTSAPEEPSLLAWLKKQTAKARRIGSICTGAFVLAQAGILDGKRATTHWGFIQDLARRFPKVIVEPHPIWTRDGNIYTSAGATSGIDLCLALVEEDLGGKLALDVARAMVLFLQRPANQAQFSVSLSVEATTSPRIRQLQVWMAEHLDEDLSLPALAEKAAMSLRTFQRVFNQEVKRTPSHYVEELRLEAVRRRLERSSLGLSLIARQCGYANVDVMTRRFRSYFKSKPLEYRARFRPPPAS